MMIDELMTTAKETLTVRRVYGDPYERGGVMLLPAASVSGGGGGGGGHDAEGPEGQGGGFGMNVKPAGVYAITDERVRWHPAVDVNRLVASLATVMIVAIIARVRIERLRSPRPARR
jgi:uncharacterized spore protein YtfJ